MKSLSRPESTLVRLASRAFSRTGRSATLVVLIFHRILAEPDPLLPSEPDAASFAIQMGLAASQFNILPLSDAVARLRDGTLPARALCVTFDDGYANNCTVALPILAARGIPATVFVATGFLNGGRMFNDTIIESIRRAPADFDLRDLGLDIYRFTGDAARLASVEQVIRKLKYLGVRERLQASNQIAARTGLAEHSDLMLTDDQVHRLSKSGIQIGAHTVNHPILTAIDAVTAREEMIAGKRRLEAITGRPVNVFAYPNGRPNLDYDSTHVTIAREVGFEAALSTAWGAAHRQSDFLQIPRIAPWDKTGLRFGLRIATSYAQRKFITA